MSEIELPTGLDKKENDDMKILINKIVETIKDKEKNGSSVSISNIIAPIMSAEKGYLNRAMLIDNILLKLKEENIIIEEIEFILKKRLKLAFENTEEANASSMLQEKGFLEYHIFDVEVNSRSENINSRSENIFDKVYMQSVNGEKIAFENFLIKKGDGIKLSKTLIGIDKEMLDKKIDIDQILMDRYHRSLDIFKAHNSKYNLDNLELPKTLTEKQRIDDLVKETIESLKGKSFYEHEIIKSVKAILYKEKDQVSKTDFAASLVSKLKEDGIIKNEGELSSIQKGVVIALRGMEEERNISRNKPSIS